MKVKEFVALIVIFCYIKSSSANRSLTSVAKCTPAFTPAATQPTLDQLVGTWYLSQTDYKPYLSELQCGTCQVVKESASKYNMQCIFPKKQNMNGQISNYFRTITSEIKYDSTNKKFTTTYSGSTIEFVAKTYDKTKCTIGMNFCLRDHNLFGLFPTINYNTIFIEATKKGPITLLHNEIVQKNCLKPTFDFTVTTGNKQTTETALRVPTDKIPTSCEDLGGFTKVTDRYFKYFAGPKNRADAKKDCESQSLILATADTAAILTAIQTMLTTASKDEAWVGLEHTEQNNPTNVGTYKWADLAGTVLKVSTTDGAAVAPSTYTAWNQADGTDYDKGQTTMDSKKFFTVNKSGTLGWKEQTGTETYPYICECSLCPQ